MSTTTMTVCTARALLESLGPCAPALDGPDLALGRDPPDALEPLLRVLHTGVRAQLAGRTWYGCAGDTGRVIELNPGQPIPDGITLLCVAGDDRWDRMSPAARIDAPELFAPSGSLGSSRRWRG
ncbi:hypothetical protein J8F10_15685 [Gemmata sp. G18]|uniref:Uncharacterized protein n=1 Tax=Gemmata palustris TaxID=2822762 RepID=A0ABS5BSK9_9BACT|nr:hypothetical protein [Gemmata palustris]MBP3956714.1 hypothetical protein [Gemmata palustris]